jgi:hypothetical protein
MDITKEDADKRHSLPYPMELGSPFFAPVEVEKEKDVLLNISKQHAKEEYDRIMEQVEVLRRQADSLMNRLEVSEIMYACKYGFTPVHGSIYYVYYDSYNKNNCLSPIHPDCWTAGPTELLSFVMAVRLRGDSSWQEVTLERNYE